MTDDAPVDPAAQPATPAQWSVTVRYFFGILLIAIGVAGVLLILPLLQIILVAFLIAFLMFIPSRALSRQFRLPYGLCVLLSFLAAALLLAGLCLLILPDLLRMFASLGATLQQAYDQFIAQLQSLAPEASVQVAGVPVGATSLLLAVRQLLPTGVGDFVQGVTHLMFGLLGGLAGVAALLGTASVVAVFFLIDLPVSGGQITDWLPAAYRREVILLFTRLDRLWLSFFRALLIIGVLMGAASGVLFVFFGVEAALMLAVVTAVLGSIPVVGRLLAVLLLFFVTATNGSTTFTEMDHLSFALLSIAAYLIVTQVINSFIAPRLKGSAINVPTVVIVIGIFIGLAAAGIVGALLVAPIIGSLRVFIQYALAKILLRDPYPGETIPPLQHEGFFSHMLYVKKPAAQTANPPARE